MSSTNDGGPAFPWHSDGYLENQDPSPGMTLRDYFAAKAMQAIVHAAYTNKGAVRVIAATAEDHGTKPAASMCQVAYGWADGMLAAREAKS